MRLTIMRQANNPVVCRFLGVAKVAKGQVAKGQACDLLGAKGGWGRTAIPSHRPNSSSTATPLALSSAPGSDSCTSSREDMGSVYNTILNCDVSVFMLGLLATLADGQIVTMNGQTGTVRLAVQSHA